MFGSFLNGLGAFLDTGAIECGLVFRTAFWHDIAEIRAGFAAQFPVVISRPYIGHSIHFLISGADSEPRAVARIRA